MERYLEFITNHPVPVAIFVVLLLALLFLESRKNGKVVGCAELTALVNQAGALVVDLRPHDDYAKGHIMHASSVPAGKLDSHLKQLKKQADKPIILVDATGQQTGMTATRLVKAGYCVYRLRGGMNQWKSENLPTIKRR